MRAKVGDPSRAERYCIGWSTVVRQPSLVGAGRDELLAASEAPSLDRPFVQDGLDHSRDQTDTGGTVGIDGEGLREDWRDAEFGGPFPDTIDLKVLVTTVRGRVERVRDMLTAPRPPRHRDHRDRRCDDQPRQDEHPEPVTETPTRVRPDDPDDPPF